GGNGPAGACQRAGAADALAAAGAARPGNGLPQMPAKGAAPALRHGGGTSGGSAAFSGGRAGSGATGQPGRTDVEVGTAQPAAGRAVRRPGDSSDGDHGGGYRRRLLVPSPGDRRGDGSAECGTGRGPGDRPARPGGETGGGAAGGPVRHTDQSGAAQ